MNFSKIKQHFQEISDRSLQTVVKLEQEGLIISQGRGRATDWLLNSEKDFEMP